MRWFVHEIGPFEDGRVAIVARNLEDPTERPSATLAVDATAALTELLSRGATPADLFVEPSLEPAAQPLQIATRPFDDRMRGAVLLESVERTLAERMAGLADPLGEIGEDLSLIGQLGQVCARFLGERPWDKLPPRAFSLHFGAEDKREGAFVGLEQDGLFLFDQPGYANGVLQRRTGGEAVDPSSYSSLGMSAVEFYPPFITGLARAFGAMDRVPMFTCTSSLGDRRSPRKRELLELAAAMWAACEAAASEAHAPFSDSELSIAGTRVPCFFASVAPLVE